MLALDTPKNCRFFFFFFNFHLHFTAFKSQGSKEKQKLEKLEENTAFFSLHLLGFVFFFFCFDGIIKTVF